MSAAPGDGQQRDLATPLGQVVLEPDASKALLQASAEWLPRRAVILRSVAQDLAHLLFGAPAVPLGAALQACLHLFFQMPDHELSHRSPPASFS